MYSALSYQAVLSSSCRIVDERADTKWGLGHSHGGQGAQKAVLVAGETWVWEGMALTGCVGRTSDRASMASTATGSPPVPGCHRRCR